MGAHTHWRYMMMFSLRIEILIHIDWELKFDAEFDKYDVSEHQMILAARDGNGTDISRPYSISI